VGADAIECLIPSFNHNKWMNYLLYLFLGVCVFPNLCENFGLILLVGIVYQLPDLNEHLVGFVCVINFMVVVFSNLIQNPPKTAINAPTKIYS
jgi:hypothetical protein